MDILKSYGLNLHWENEFNKNTSSQCEIARVVTCFTSKDILIATQSGLRRCMTSQKLLTSNAASLPVPGDWVRARSIKNDEYILESILDRKSIFYRKKPGSLYEEQVIGVNLDKLFLVTSMNKEYNPRRLERYITQAQKCRIELIIVLSKADLVTNPDSYVEITRRIHPDGKVLTVSALEGVNGIQSLIPHLIPGETVGFVGASGVGKSTIINTLIGTEVMKVGHVSEATSKGRHTTTRRELILFNNGTILLDTPGMREFGVLLEENDSKAGFPEILEWAKYCTYSNCQHKNEKGCAVNQAVENGIILRKRLDNYHKITYEQDFLWVKGRRISKEKLNYSKGAKDKEKYKRNKYNYFKD